MSVSYETIDSTDPVVPTTEPQTIISENGAFYDSIVVDAIPSNYVDTTGATATEVDILSGKTAAIDGGVVTGAMANNGSVTTTIDGLTSTSVTIPAGYTTGGTVSLTNDIEQALAAI